MVCQFYNESKGILGHDKKRICHLCGDEPVVGAKDGEELMPELVKQLSPQFLALRGRSSSALQTTEKGKLSRTQHYLCLRFLEEKVDCTENNGILDVMFSFRNSTQALHSVHQSVKVVLSLRALQKIIIDLGWQVSVSLTKE